MKKQSKVWVWLGNTDGHEYEDLDILCLQLSPKRFVYLMESGDYEFESDKQSPDKLITVGGESYAWWLAS